MLAIIRRQALVLRRYVKAMQTRVLKSLLRVVYGSSRIWQFVRACHIRELKREQDRRRVQWCVCAEPSFDLVRVNDGFIISAAPPRRLSRDQTPLIGGRISC